LTTPIIQKSSLFACEPSWRPNRTGTRQQLPANVRSWTYETGSLTQRLRRFYGSAVTVKVLRQRWQTPFLSERQQLTLPEHRFALVREVLLYAHDRPLILARTIIPTRTLKAARSNLAKLGTRPLGEVIFAYPKLERLQLDVTLIQPALWTPAARELAQIQRPVWSRRTVYGLHHRTMLVSECFLPEALVL
jgi:chorismate--pyruvate lyase